MYTRADDRFPIFVERYEHRFVDLQDPVLIIENNDHVGREVKHGRYGDAMGEEVYLCSSNLLHVDLPGDEEHIEIFRYKIPVHMQFRRDIRDGHPPRVPFQVLFDSIHPLLIEHAHTRELGAGIVNFFILWG
ncbi:hypothetical protein DSECCO2_625990 [anaerobic digester metagenome]